jgi:uncharacterized integral membrane protein
MNVKLVVSLVLAFLAFVFIIQNTNPVQVKFLAWSMEMSIVVLLVVMLAAGVIIGWAMCSYLRYSRHRRSAQDSTARQSKEIR